LRVLHANFEGSFRGILAKIQYPLYSLIVEQGSATIEIEAADSDAFLYMAPTHGRFDNRLWDKAKAEVFYHHMVNGTRDLLVYPPNDNGEYQIICSTVMRIPPKLTVEFNNPSLEAVQLEDQHSHKVKFRIRSRGGFVKNADLRHLIRSIELNSEL